MSDDERPRFNLRLTPELEALVVSSSRKAGRSKNAEILAALEARYRPDSAIELADALRPLMENLSPEQREIFVDLVRQMARGKRRRRS